MVMSDNENRTKENINIEPRIALNHNMYSDKGMYEKTGRILIA